MKFDTLVLIRIFLISPFFDILPVIPHELPFKTLNLGYNNNNLENQVYDIRYGPLIVETSNFFYANKIFLILARNPNKQRIFLGLDCNRNLLNVANTNLEWKEWQSPNQPFEEHILGDYCGLIVSNGIISF